MWCSTEFYKLCMLFGFIGLIISFAFVVLTIIAFLEKEGRIKRIVSTLLCMALSITLIVGYRHTTDYFKLTEGSQQILDDTFFMERDTKKVFVLKEHNDWLRVWHEKFYVDTETYVKEND